jgi:hypothetical protein
VGHLKDVFRILQLTRRLRPHHTSQLFKVVGTIFHDVWRRASSYDVANGTVLGWIMNQALAGYRSPALREPKETQLRHPQRDVHELAGSDQGPSQFHHVVDIAPTILEAAGVQPPLILNGTAQKPLEGVSMTYTFANAKAPTRHNTQYFEIAANRGLYWDGWMASTTPLRLPWHAEQVSQFS